MKNEVIKLNSSFTIDLPQMIDSRLLVQANSGGGKSWLIRRILEQSHGKVQQIILDPEGEFSTLREKYDYILAGKGGDVPTESRSAALLARKLLELNTSAIIDLYELPPQERKHFVKLFLDAMINAPKELWHHCIIVIDEAHVFAPEKDQSEASSAVIDLATRGRKRGFCAVLATQRISKLAKDAAAECNNKLIGRSAMDIDMKRAGEELGFTSKDQFLSLRSLEPGEFFAFGPAISTEVLKLKVGEVKTSHPKAGSRLLTKTTPPTDKIKKVLAKLTDLPAEAAKEAKTVEDLKAEIRELRRHRCEKGADPKEIERAVMEVRRSFDGERINFTKKVKLLQDALDKIFNLATHARELSITPPLKIMEFTLPPITVINKEKLPFSKDLPGGVMSFENDSQDIGICAKKIYSFLYKNSDRGFTKVQIGAVTGYSPKSGGFSNSIAKLNSLGLIKKSGELISMWAINHNHLIEGEEFSAEPRFWERKLGKCEIEVYKFLWDNPNKVFSKEEIAGSTSPVYSPSSGGFNNAVSRLNSIGLIRRENGGLRVNPDLIDL